MQALVAYMKQKCPAYQLCLELHDLCCHGLDDGFVAGHFVQLGPHHHTASSCCKVQCSPRVVNRACKPFRQQKTKSELNLPNQVHPAQQCRRTQLALPDIMPSMPDATAADAGMRNLMLTKE